MRILFLSHRIPYPPDKGDKIRSFHLLSALARQHDVRLITHADDVRDLQHVARLREMCSSVSVYPRSGAARIAQSVRAFATGRPLSFARFHDAAAAREIRNVLLAEPPDVVVVFSAQPAEYLPEKVAVPVIVDLVDVDSEKWAGYAERARGVTRRIYEREHRLVRAFEKNLVERGFRIAVVTETEASLFRRVVADVPIAVIPNGVDAAANGVSSGRIPGLLMFTGAMDYVANIEAAITGARDVLPLVRRTIPGARLRIVGRNPDRAVRALASLPGVEVAGEVTSVGAELARAEVSLLPLRIVRGVPNKVLESFAHGVPVVATSSVLAAIGATDGVQAFASDSPEGLAKAVVGLLQDRGLAARVGSAGRDFALERFRWDRFEADMLELVDEIAQEAASA